MADERTFSDSVMKRCRWASRQRDASGEEKRQTFFLLKAEDYVFIAMNSCPWDRVPTDSYLRMAISNNVAVVDATNTLLAVHKTDIEGNFAGNNNNKQLIGKVDYHRGMSSSAQYVTAMAETRHTTRNMFCYTEASIKARTSMKTTISPTLRNHKVTKLFDITRKRTRTESSS